MLTYNYYCTKSDWWNCLADRQLPMIITQINHVNRLIDLYKHLPHRLVDSNPTGTVAIEVSLSEPHKIGTTTVSSVPMYIACVAMYVCMRVVLRCPHVHQANTLDILREYCNGTR